ncbi:hypothetical protein GN316_02850 [Xylophilus sp. Kf1]|nr:hypothetical protein [Xylophilus sp. Kf1]
MNTQNRTPTTAEEPKPVVGEDSIPQDEGTDNEWQMEPLKDMPRQEREDSAK